MQSNNIVGALQSFQQVLAIDPRNVEALANQGWLVAITGNTANDQTLIDKGLATIRTAEQIDPSYADAHFFAGSILLNGGQAKDAVTEFEVYLADDPSSTQAALVRQDLQTAAGARGREAAGRRHRGRTDDHPVAPRSAARRGPSPGGRRACHDWGVPELLLFLMTGVLIYCLIDIATSRREEVRNLPKWAWFVLAFVLSIVGVRCGSSSAARHAARVRARAARRRGRARPVRT